jgi:16S rRNA (adenine1518-N6/adenine1519-N6)-dimethyltransferase
LLELDGKFAAYWRGRAETSKVSIRVIECDALQEDWSGLGLKPGSLFVSNLPYQISSSIVIERSIEPAGVSRMILMFQKEVAQRLAAKPSSKDYGLLTVIAQAFWDIRTVCDASPGDFFPPPNVASRVLMFKRRTEPFSDARAAAGFLKFAKAAFSHRRKLLSRNLIGEYFGGDKSRLERIEAVLAECGLKSTARAEELDPKTFVRLYESFKPGTNS